MKKQIVVYNDDITTFIENNKEDIKEALIDDGEPTTEENINYYAEFMLNDDAESLKEIVNSFDNLNNCKILVVADLGLWYGRRAAKAYFSNLYTAIFKVMEEQNKVYFNNKKTTLKASCVHHDGCNNFAFYKIVNGKKRAITFDDLMR